MSATNAYGRCNDSDVWLTRDPNANIVGDGFKGLVSNFPVVGPFMAGMISDTYTANAIRQCPGATIDHSTDYNQELILGAVVLSLIVIYLVIP